MKQLRRLRRRRNEKGAVAIVLALCLVVLMAAAALGVDIAKLASERQQLRNALDAAASAGAQQLPTNPTQAATDAQTFFAANLPAGDVPTLAVSLRCVVGRDTTTNTPDWATVVSVCGITSKTFDPANCNDWMCSIPCDTSISGVQCNTIVVSATKTVQYTFGPAIGIPTGTTSQLTSAACRGFCGTAVPNPMDVVVMADRTPSMDSDDVVDMQKGIKAMLGNMTRDQQYVAFGAIHKSVTDASGCKTAVLRGYDQSAYSTNNSSGKVFTGSWVPQQFSASYTTGNRNDNTLAVNTSDDLYKAVDCLKQYKDLRTYTSDKGDVADDPDTYTNDKSLSYPSAVSSTWTGTHLAAALKGAGRYLYGYDSNNLSSMADRSDYGHVQKVIILETDGRPEEVFTSPNTGSSDTNKNPLSLSNSYEPASTNGDTACTNLKKVATALKALSDPPLIITIGYGNVDSFTCAKTTKTKSNPLGNVTGGTLVKSVLASVASNQNSTTVSTADKSTCAEENRDGDYYFCASDGNDLASVFTTVMGSIKGHGRLMSLPGISS